MQIGFIVILIIAIFVAIFAIQNGVPVPVDLFFVRYEMPLAVIMMICLILGAVIVLVLDTTKRFKRRSEYKELQNKMKAFEEEKTQGESKLHTLEAEKAKLEESIKTLESEKEELKDTNSLLREKVEELERKITQQEEVESRLKEEVQLLKTERVIENNNTEEITKLDEGVAQTDNEKSEVESQ
ncbi:MAG TPA: DUF1049 domain-containing protein [Tissierellia bacterium]|jgi:putative membrane protein|nr:DUF1049 domain-containing protein [Tissierellia bacterium]